MKKTIIVSIISALIIGTATPAMAEKDINRITPWNKITDFFATVGRDKDTKKSIRANRKQSRRETRMFKKRRKARKKTMKRMEKQKAKILKGVKKRKMPHGRGGVDMPK